MCWYIASHQKMKHVGKTEGYHYHWYLGYYASYICSALFAKHISTQTTVDPNVPGTDSLEVHEVPTIYEAYFSGLCFREYPHKIWSEIWNSSSILGSRYIPIDKTIYDRGRVLLPEVQPSCTRSNS